MRWCTYGSLGYRNEQIKRRLNYAINHGFTKFKIKVGKSLEDDKRRLAVVRDVIGGHLDTIKSIVTEKTSWLEYVRISWNRKVLNANQCWEVDEAIAWIKELKDFKPMWIEEPTSPDDVLGHGKISLEAYYIFIFQAVNPLGIKVATGQHCQNRVLFKQFFQTNAMQVCEVDACRLAGVNEVLAVMLMAKKYNVPVCPSAGGVGLCEMIQHIAIFDYISVSGTVEGRVAEYSDFLHDHFMHPIRLRNAHYQAPTAAGFCTEMLEESTINFEYPKGWKWKELFEEGVYQDPRNSKPKHIQHFGIAPHRVPSATHYQLF
ncbi:unnamed protein product [Darwinula stevensoni]|uniref:Mandelate racemase/muconate lactonizing enzyme C-terminal domain-containing protein n=1 Tax=Darwinula stevensoni TaxID=69355 RepID=A0A7R9AG30_9CRUS|nr:unnamed protein product [Darwinula stevensoni]CAG0903910.1 unnamed protein product [Darwinula stevensoni]